MDKNEWVAISYTLPREPSRARVSVWRKLKKIGAVNIPQSMWTLHLSDENHRMLSEIKNEVIQNGGKAFIITFSVEEDGREIIISEFNRARDEEYGEFIEQCGDFFKEIDKETARKNFIFAEIEENEEELGKLRQWYEKISARDAFGAPLGEKSKEALSGCADVLNEFCEKVYKLNDEG